MHSLPTYSKGMAKGVCHVPIQVGKVNDITPETYRQIGVGTVVISVDLGTTIQIITNIFFRRMLWPEKKNNRKSWWFSFMRLTRILIIQNKSYTGLSVSKITIWNGRLSASKYCDIFRRKMKRIWMYQRESFGFVVLMYWCII